MARADQTVKEKLPQDALLATKLFRPVLRRELVHRERLTERLAAVLECPLTVVVAPAGWGKSSLIAEWLATQHVSGVAWLTLDEADNDLVQFLRYVIGAVRTVVPDFGQPSLSRLDSVQPPTTESILSPMVNELTTLPEDVVVVLDDYHVIEIPAIHQALTFLVDHLPPNAHLIVTARTNPPLPLARLRAQGSLNELRAAELAFTTEEATKFLNDAMDLQLSLNDVRELESRTEGWIAGLHLAALGLRGRAPALRHDFISTLSGTHRYILDYLAGEVFDRQPPDVQRFLLCTAILGGLTGALCDAVLGESMGSEAAIDGQTMLERLDDANLFVIRLDDTRTWYRYHQLFAGFLAERLRRDRPDLVPELHRRAARWLEESGRPAYAAEHALAAEDFDEAARLLEAVIGPMIWQRGEVVTLQRWLERLPREATRKRPRLSLDLAWALLWSAQIDKIETRLQDAEQALQDDPGPDARALRGEVAAIRAELARQAGDTDAAIIMARRALDDLPPDARLVRGATSGLLGQAQLVSGDAVAAGQAFAEAADLGMAPNTLALALIAQGRLVQAEALQGRLHRAASTYHQTLAQGESYGMSAAPALGVAQVYMADVLREWNDLTAAEDLVREGVARCSEWAGLAEMALDGCVTLARLLQARGDADDAFDALSMGDALGRGAHVSQSPERIALARVWLWLDFGDETAVTRWVRSQQSGPQEPGYVSLLERVMQARVHLAQQRPDEAFAALDRLLEVAEAGGLGGCTIEILALRALSLQGQGQIAQAMPVLARALELAEPQGYIRLFVDEGAGMARLLREARSRGAASAYVDNLLAAFAAAGTPTGDDGLVEPLSPRELELLRLLASGLSTTEIAEQLFITTGTARNHLKSIYGKLDVHSRVQAIERARTLRVL